MGTIQMRVRASLVALLLAAIASIGIAGCSENNPTSPDNGSAIKRPSVSNQSMQRGTSIHLRAE